MWIPNTITVISAVVVLLNASVQTANGCPLNCECSPIDGSNSHIYAKCDNLDIFDDSTFAETIKYVNLSNSKLKQLTKNLDKFNLVGIDLSFNYLSKLTKFSDNTKYLNLSHNELVSGSILELPHNVEELNLSHNKITSLPIDLMKLKNLRDLDLSGNEIDCTCETIEVRNWLLGKSVHIANPIRCSSPFQFKDKPWKSVKTNQACKMLSEDFMDGNPLHDSDNYLMVNDQNVISDNPTENDEDEIGKYYLLADHKKINDATLIDHIEGSGYANPVVDHLDLQEASGDNILELDENDEEVTEHSGSGGGILSFEEPILRKYNIPVQSEVGEKVLSTTEKVEEDTPSIPVVPDPVVVEDEEPFKYQLGIMKPLDEQSKTTPGSVPDVVDHIADSADPKADGAQDGSRKAEIHSPPEADLSQASTGGSLNNSDDTNTYILLGVILVLVVGVIIFVGIRRNRSSRSGVRPKGDDHQKGTELVYMKSRDPEKPSEKYKIPEKTPLIEEVKKIDEKNSFADPKKDDDKMAKQPLLKDEDKKDGVLPEQRNGLKESNNNAAEPVKQQEAPKPQESAPPKDKPESPNPPRTDSYPPPKTKAESPYPSPRPSRYSPVYSPETGRVKIKLAETPKPKTPQLITRTSANGGANISDTSAVP